MRHTLFALGLLFAAISCGESYVEEAISPRTPGEVLANDYGQRGYFNEYRGFIVGDGF